MASVEKRSTKAGQPRWRVVWWQDGARQQQTYGNQQAAVAFRKRVEGYGNRWPPGEDPRKPASTGPLTFGAWARRAVEQRARANERTRGDYLRDLDRHFTLLDPVPLADLDTAHVAHWETDRQSACRCGHAQHAQPCPADGCRCRTGRALSAKTIRNLHGFASSIMADALSQHPPLASHNPFANRLGRHSTVRTEEMVFFTPPEFDLILRRVLDERHYPELLRLLYGTGLRYGEATALLVRDVELFGKRKTLTVTKAWKRTGPAAWVLGEPKTPRARRTLSLSPELVDMLIPLVSGRRGDERLFPAAAGGRLPHIEVYKRAWAPAVARANVCDTHYAQQRDGRGKPPRLPTPCDCPGVLGKTPRIHDIRHSWVSALIAEGIRIEVISKRAGHSSITITVDRYGHLDPSTDAEVDAAIDRVLARR